MNHFSRNKKQNIIILSLLNYIEFIVLGPSVSTLVFAVLLLTKQIDLTNCLNF